MRGALTPLAVAASLVAVALFPTTALGRPGALDRSFGDNGRVVTQTDLGGQSWLDARVHIAEGPDGTIIAAVGNSVFRYLPDGSLDPSFGEDGKLIVTAELEGMPFTPHDLVVDEEGRVYLLGGVEVTSARVPFDYMGGTIHPWLAAIIRYTAEGTLDRSFGDESGYVVTDLGQPSPFGSAVSYDKALTTLVAGVVDRAGDLIGIASVGGFPCSVGHSELRMLSKLIVQLTPDGGLDPSFGGGDGVQTIAELTGFGPLTVDQHGEIAVAGGHVDSCTEPAIYAVARLRPDGSADLGFGKQGLRALPAPAKAIALDRLGRTVVLLPDSRVLRLTPTGALDRRFGRRGRSFLRRFGAIPRSLAVEPSGRVLLAGNFLPRAFAVARLTARGRTDRRFGRHGWVETRFGRHSSALGQEAYIDRRGRLVVGGTVAGPDVAPTGGVALARYRLGR